MFAAMKRLLLRFTTFVSMLSVSTARSCLSWRSSCLAFQRAAPRKLAPVKGLAHCYSRRQNLIPFGAFCSGRHSFSCRTYSASSTQNLDEPSKERQPPDEEKSDRTAKNSGSQNQPKPFSKKDAAQHELDHRIRHKGIVEASQLLAEKFVEAVEQPVGKKLAEHASERVMERSVERAAERAGEHAVGHRVLKEGLAKVAGERVVEDMAERVGERGIIERLGERLGEEALGKRVGERIVNRGGQRVAKDAGEVAVKATEKLVEGTGGKVSEYLAERTAERFSAEAGERFAEQTAEKATEHLVERIGAKMSGERLTEHLASTATQRLSGEAGAQIAERVGSKAAKPAAELLVARAEQSVLKREVNGLSRWMKRVWESVFARESTARAVERQVEDTVERIGERSILQAGHATGVPVSGSGRIIARRLGRGTMIAIPALGGLFVLHILRQDLVRCRREWEAGQGSVAKYCWAGAVLADGMDVFAHGIIVYSLLVMQTHHVPLVFGQISLGCAVASTICAVIGELCSKANPGDKALTKAKDFTKRKDTE